MAGVVLTGAGSPQSVRGSSSRHWLLAHAVWSDAGAWADGQAWRDWLLGGGAWDDIGVWADSLTWDDGTQPFVGPLDIVGNALVGYGQRALSAASRGTPLYTVRENSGDTTQSFNSDGTTGAVSVSAVTTFLNGASGFISLWNDQSGNAVDETQADNTLQPQWITGVSGGQPGFFADDVGGAIGICLSSSESGFAGGALTVFVVCNCPDLTGAPPDFMETRKTSNSSETNLFGTYYNVPGDLFLHVIGGMSWATDGTITNGVHIIEMVVQADGAVAMYADGVDMVATLQSGPVQAPLAAFSSFFEGPSRDGGQVTHLEMLAWNTALSAPNRLAIRQNMATYYGISL